MTLVINTPCRSRPIAASMRSRSWPARPTKGRPMRSSSAPGASPMIMTGAQGLPSAKTVLVAVRFKAQSSKPATNPASAATVSALAASRRADCAASAGDSARAFGGAAGTARAADGGGGGATTGADAASWTAGDGAKRFVGSLPIASSAPISICQRNSAIAASRSRGSRGVAGDGIATMLSLRPSGALPFLLRSDIVVRGIPRKGP
jgi:hypothetical protein